MGIPIGLLSGFGLHGILAPIITGTFSPQPWTSTALPLLGAITAASAAYFYFCGNWDSRALFWEARFDPLTGQEYLYNTRSQEKKPNNDAGFDVADSAR